MAGVGLGGQGLRDGPARIGDGPARIGWVAAQGSSQDHQGVLAGTQVANEPLAGAEETAATQLRDQAGEDQRGLAAARGADHGQERV